MEPSHVICFQCCMFGEEEVNQALRCPQTFRVRGQEDVLQPPHADRLGMLHPIHPVSSWTADTGVEENKDTSWCCTATGNLSQEVLCLHALMCYGQSLPSAVLCHPRCHAVSRRWMGALLLALQLREQEPFLSLSLAQCCEAAQDLMLTYSMCVWILSVQLNIEWQNKEARPQSGEEQVSFYFLFFPLGSPKSHFLCHAQHSSACNSKTPCFHMQNAIVTIEFWCICSPPLTKALPTGLFSASFTQTWVFLSKEDLKCDSNSVIRVVVELKEAEFTPSEGYNCLVVLFLLNWLKSWDYWRVRKPVMHLGAQICVPT